MYRFNEKCPKMWSLKSKGDGVLAMLAVHASRSLDLAVADNGHCPISPGSGKARIIF